MLHYMVLPEVIDHVLCLMTFYFDRVFFSEFSSPLHMHSQTPISNQTQRQMIFSVRLKVQLTEINFLIVRLIAIKNFSRCTALVIDRCIVTSGECLLTGACNCQSCLREKTNEDLRQSFSVRRRVQASRGRTLRELLTAHTSSRLVQTSDNRTQSVYLNDDVRVDTSNQLDTDEDCKQSYSACDTETHVDSAENGFTCTVCNKNFKKPSKLKVHMRIHTGDRPFNCGVCDKKFIELSKLNAHMRSHTGERPFSCEVCSKTFALQSTRRIHMFTHTGERPFRCEICGKSFTKSAKLKGHMRVHARDRASEKQSCPAGDAGSHVECSFTEDCELYSTDLGSPGADDDGGFQVGSTKDCRNLDSARDCGQTSQYLPNFEDSGCVLFPQPATDGANRSRRCARTVKRTLACDVCGKQFQSSYNLRTHIRIHTGERPFICAVCDKRFINFSNLRTHMRIHTGERPFGCQLCEKAFVESTHLKIHMRTHTRERPFGCAVCGKTYTESQHLKRHEQVHAGVRNHACQVCGKKFFGSSAVKIHMVTHSGERRFGCELCSSRFARKEHLHRHMRAHSGLRPFSCSVCDKRFIYKHNLKVHLRLHPGVESTADQQSTTNSQAGMD